MAFFLPMEETPEAPIAGQTYDVIIIGGGPAGLTAALYAARGGISTAVLEKDMPGGTVATTTQVENCPGCIEGSGADIGRHMLRQAVRFGAKFGSVEVTRLVLQASPKEVWAGKDLYLARSLILAPGTQPRRLNVPGEQEYWGKGVSFCSTCDAPLFKGKDIVVVGGGNSALQESELLLRYVSHLTIIQHRDRLTATQVLQDRVLGHPGARVRFNSAIREIKGDGAVRSVLLEDTKSGAKEEMPVQGVFIFIGLLPNNGLLQGQLDMDEQGYVVTGPQMETKISGVFVAGDVRRGAPRQIVTSASDGAVAALSVIEYLRGK